MTRRRPARVPLLDRPCVMYPLAIGACLLLWYLFR